MVSHRGDRVNPGDVLDCSLYVDLRIAEEEPEEEPEEDPTCTVVRRRNSYVVIIISFYHLASYYVVVPLISLYLRRNCDRRIDTINSAVCLRSFK